MDQGFLPFTKYFRYFIQALDSTKLPRLPAAGNPLYSSIVSPTSSRTLVPTLPPSSFPEKSSQRDIVQPLTVFPQPLAKLAPSLPKLGSVNLRTLVVTTNSWSICKLHFSWTLPNADLFFQLGNLRFVYVDGCPLHPLTSWDQGQESWRTFQRGPRHFRLMLVLAFLIVLPSPWSPSF